MICAQRLNARASSGLPIARPRVKRVDREMFVGEELVRSKLETAVGRSARRLSKTAVAPGHPWGLFTSNMRPGGILGPHEGMLGPIGVCDHGLSGSTRR